MAIDFNLRDLAAAGLFKPGANDNNTKTQLSLDDSISVFTTKNTSKAQPKKNTKKTNNSTETNETKKANNNSGKKATGTKKRNNSLSSGLAEELHKKQLNCIDKQIKAEERREKLWNEKASNGMTYKDALGILEYGQRSVWIYDRKLGHGRKATRDEALEMLRKQAETNPGRKDCKEIYEKYKKAYEAVKELEKKHPELNDGKLHWGSESYKKWKDTVQNMYKYYKECARKGIQPDEDMWLKKGN